MPTDDARRASAEAFYVLCDNYEDWKDKKSFQRSIEKLIGSECIPAVGDKENWYSPESLYAPYRSEAFESQANILDFRNFARLKRELIEELGVTINPETEMVVNHLLYCVERDVQPHVSTYQMLNERAQNADPVIKSLVGTRCVYVESQKLFVRPNQIYWMSQQLGKYAFTIPGNLESFKPLFTAIGVKNAPAAEDYVDLLLDIVKEHYEQAKTVTGAARVVYDTCLSGIAAADAQDQFGHSELVRLQESPIVLNLKNQLIFPDEIFLQDSEWHVSFFHGELDSALCKPALELWPLLEKIGVQRLSDCAEVSLEYVDGENKPEFHRTAEVKCMHCRGTEYRRPFLSMQVYGGDLFEQANLARDFVLDRIDRAVGVRDVSITAPATYELPPDAVGEAIVNAIAHRDYHSNASVEVRLFADRLEIWNPGSLPGTLTMDSLRHDHPSVPYNPLLAESLYLARYIERVGSGTQTMIELCREVGLSEPQFEQREGFFVTTIWRDWLTPEILSGMNLNERQVKGISFVKAHGRITNREYRELTTVTIRTASRDLEDMVVKAILKKFGATGRNTFYCLAGKLDTK